MTLKMWQPVWIPCKVLPGSRTVWKFITVEDNGDEWTGVTQDSFLQDPSPGGSTYIEGMVTGFQGDVVMARPRAETPIGSNVFRGPASALKVR